MDIKEKRIRMFSEEKKDFEEENTNRFQRRKRRLKKVRRKNMTKVKVFKDITTYYLECQINDWVKENHKNILSATTTRDNYNSHLIASIVYED